MPYKDPERQRTTTNQSRILRRKRIRLWLHSYLTTNPCVDCGEADPVVLEFDHQRDKSFGIGKSSSVSPSLNRLIAEVAKCEVRCANCHRRKTYTERKHTHKD